MDMNQTSSRQRDEDAAYEMQKTKAIINFIMLLFARTVEVFLRRDFGSRYLTAGGAFSSGVLLVIGLVLLEDAVRRTPLEMVDVQVMGLFLVAVVGLSIYHIWQAKWRKDREPIHSRYSGTSRLSDFAPFNNFKEYTIKRWIEPILVLIVGSVLTSVLPILGAWLTVAAVCMAARTYIAAAAMRERVLDLIDKEIDAEAFEVAVKGEKQASSNKGFDVWQVFSPKEQELLLRGRTPVLKTSYLPPNGATTQMVNQQSIPETSLTQRPPEVVRSIEATPTNISHMVGSLDPALQAMVSKGVEPAAVIPSITSTPVPTPTPTTAPTPSQRECPQCKAPARMGAKFCDDCGVIIRR